MKGLAGSSLVGDPASESVNGSLPMVEQPSELLWQNLIVTHNIDRISYLEKTEWQILCSLVTNNINQISTNGTVFILLLLLVTFNHPCTVYKIVEKRGVLGT